MNPEGAQDGSHVRREAQHEEVTKPSRRALSPALQGIVDQQERDREVYEDYWTNRTFSKNSADARSLNLDENQKKDKSGSQPPFSTTNQVLADDKNNKDIKD